MKDLNLMLTIAKRADKKEFSSFFKNHEVKTVYSLDADGTTNSKTLSLLGIERTEKTVFLSVVSGLLAKKLMKGLSRELYIDLPDRGIAVACPLVSVGGAATLSALTSGTINEKDENDMNTERELIIVITNRNTTDLVMDAAREGGARGGTVLHAKGTADKGSTTFFGVSLAEEKEVILIVAKGDDRNSILRSIMQKAGANTPAGALAFTLPISHAAGFANADPIPDDSE
ncbi:MAG: P-II family nitrogen regulator [Clostridia bacterium]|nr:P-II family nitrogen regulator [Clostridia bacterium]